MAREYVGLDEPGQPLQVGHRLSLRWSEGQPGPGALSDLKVHWKPEDLQESHTGFSIQQALHARRLGQRLPKIRLAFGHATIAVTFGCRAYRDRSPHRWVPQRPLFS